MPELPEVETIARELKKKIVGLKITDLWADREKPFKQSGGLKKFLKEIKNKKIVDVRRRAKFVIIDLEGPKSIFVHQKISGHLLYGQWKKVNGDSDSATRLRRGGTFDEHWKATKPGPLRDDPQNKYLRIIFFLSNGHQVALSDLRRFGKVMLVGDPIRGKGTLRALAASNGAGKEIAKLGPEPLEINFNEFKKLFAKKKGRLKPILMNPYFIAGIGNIYSDEILWNAGYHPLARVEKLKESALKKIFDSIRKILKKAIKYQGDSMDDYRLPNGEKGRYQEIQNAYQQTGKKCKKGDGGIIQRLRVAGRSAHFCPKHQRL